MEFCAQSHVRDTLAAINVIVERTNCIYGVREALGRADYEAAAAFVGKFLGIQEQHGALGPGDGAQAAEQAQVSPCFDVVALPARCKPLRS